MPESNVEIDSLGISSVRSENVFTGAEVGKPNHTTVDLAENYSSVEELDGVGFSINETYWLFTTVPTAHYNQQYVRMVSDGVGGLAYDSGTSIYNTIDISSCQTFEDVVRKVTNKSSYSGYNLKATADPDVSTKIIFETQSPNDTAEKNNTKTLSDITPCDSDVKKVLITPGAPASTETTKEYIQWQSGSFTMNIGSTELFEGQKFVGFGGQDTVINEEKVVEPPVQSSTMTVDLSSVSLDGKGIVIKDNYNRVMVRLEFLDDDSGFKDAQRDDDKVKSKDLEEAKENPSWIGETTTARTTTTLENTFSIYNGPNPSYLTVGKNTSDSFESTDGKIKITIDKGKITITTPPPSERDETDNGWSVTEGFTSTYWYRFRQSVTEKVESTEAKDPGTEERIYRAVKTLQGVNNLKDATDPTDATFKIDLSAYQNNTSTDDLEAFIADLSGKTIHYGQSGNNHSYTFMDTALLGKYLDQISLETDKIDLNPLRKSVRNGKSIAEAVIELFTSDKGMAKSFVDDDRNVRLRADLTGLPGNDERVYATSYKTYPHYDIDYRQWFANNPDFKIPEDLYGKGFRVYCATDEKQWFNFQFTNKMTGEHSAGEEDIYTKLIDVSKVTDASSLVKAIYEQAEPWFNTIDKDNQEVTRDDHFLHMSANTESGVLTVYDRRSDFTSLSYLKKNYPNAQDSGTKISDGIIDYLIPTHDRKNIRLSVRTLQIQDTTKSSMNIRLHIPQMTLNNIFYPLPDRTKHVQDYDVVLKANRDALLGDPKTDPPVKGIIDQGMDYLLEANTLIGAQLSRLEFTETNIGKTLENTQAAESIIRDADMAKSITDYTKQNILMQASQSMLAQANQNLSGVLSLLQ